MAYHISRELFDRFAGEVLRRVPERYRRRLRNVRIAVEDIPAEEESRQAGVPRHALLGLFVGAAYQGEGGFFDIPAPLPDSIILYQKNIEAVCDSEEQLMEEIRLTLLHEVGHYFGMSEDQLEKY